MNQHAFFAVVCWIARCLVTLANDRVFLYRVLLLSYNMCVNVGTVQYCSVLNDISCCTVTFEEEDDDNREQREKIRIFLDLHGIFTRSSHTGTVPTVQNCCLPGTPQYTYLLCVRTLPRFSRLVELLLSISYDYYFLDRTARNSSSGDGRPLQEH